MRRIAHILLSEAYLRRFINALVKHFDGKDGVIHFPHKCLTIKL